MIEKIRTIKNPLTIIAIFAGIAEISGTIVLPFISSENQSIYIWFLMLFPILLVFIFFATLNFNHRVLYAPSDYKNEDNFIKSLQKASFAEKALKLEEEIKEIETNELENQQFLENSKNKSTCNTLIKRSIQAAYMLAEELAFEKLSKEFNSPIQREVKIGKNRNRYIFDGLVRENDKTIAIEIKFLRTNSIHILKRTIDKIIESIHFLPNSEKNNFEILLVIVTDKKEFSFSKIVEQLHKYNFNIPVKLKFYYLDELEKEFKINL